MKIIVCDLCKEEIPKMHLEYKCRAKQIRSSTYGLSWEKIDICGDCLDEIIEASKQKKTKEVNKEEEVNSDRTILYKALDLKDTVAADKEGGNADSN